MRRSSPSASITICTFKLNQVTQRSLVENRFRRSRHCTRWTGWEHERLVNNRHAVFRHSEDVLDSNDIWCTIVAWFNLHAVTLLTSHCRPLNVGVGELWHNTELGALTH